VAGGKINIIRQEAKLPIPRRKKGTNIVAEASAICNLLYLPIHIPQNFYSSTSSTSSFSLSPISTSCPPHTVSASKYNSRAVSSSRNRLQVETPCDLRVVRGTDFALLTTMPEPNYYASKSPSTFTKAKMPFSWPSIPNPIPRRYRRRLRSKLRAAQSPASSIASIETSFNPYDTLRALRTHRWSVYDGQYLILIIIGIFSLSISQAPGPVMKTAAASLLMLALLVPATRQFFLPFLPIATWLVFFFNARYVFFFKIHNSIPRGRGMF